MPFSSPFHPTVIQRAPSTPIDRHGRIMQPLDSQPPRSTRTSASSFYHSPAPSNLSQTRSNQQISSQRTPRASRSPYITPDSGQPIIPFSSIQSAVTNQDKGPDINRVISAIQHAKNLVETLEAVRQVVVSETHKRELSDTGFQAEVAKRRELEAELGREKKRNQDILLELHDIKYQKSLIEARIVTEKEQKEALYEELQGFRVTQLTNAAEKGGLQAENASLQDVLSDTKARLKKLEYKMADYHIDASKGHNDNDTRSEKRHSEILRAINSLQSPQRLGFQTAARKRARKSSVSEDVPLTHVWQSRLDRLTSNLNRFDVVQDPESEDSPTYKSIFLELVPLLSTQRGTPRLDAFLEYSRQGSTYCIIQALREVDFEAGQQAEVLKGNGCKDHKGMGECLRVECISEDKEAKAYRFLPFDWSKLATN
ncbi:hypothetical protein LZ32DRAFT_657433 [Colletotrichum eremochloae]|nr:hypothetical protein LZ32DRAFT_657433 [Colletotrichum eremochloae]